MGPIADVSHLRGLDFDNNDVNSVKYNLTGNSEEVSLMPRTPWLDYKYVRASKNRLNGKFSLKKYLEEARRVTLHADEVLVLSLDANSFTREDLRGVGSFIGAFQRNRGVMKERYVLVESSELDARDYLSEMLLQDESVCAFRFIEADSFLFLGKGNATYDRILEVVAKPPYDFSPEEIFDELKGGPRKLPALKNVLSTMFSKHGVLARPPRFKQARMLGSRHRYGPIWVPGD
jgi:hypothetical protein